MLGVHVRTYVYMYACRKLNLLYATPVEGSFVKLDANLSVVVALMFPALYNSVK